MQSEDFCGEELANKYYLSLDKSLKVKERKSRKQGFLKMLNLIEDYKTTPIDSIDFLYENKNTQEIKEFIVYWDESIMQEIKSKYTFLNECIAKNRIPDRPEGSTKSGSCKNCKYVSIDTLGFIYCASPKSPLSSCLFAIHPNFSCNKWESK